MMTNKVSTMVVAIILMVLSTLIITSSAQGVDEPSNTCAMNVSTHCDYNKNDLSINPDRSRCCEALKDATSTNTDTVCYCSVVSVAAGNSTMSADFMDQMFLLCDMPRTVASLCPESKSKTGIITGITVGVVALVVSLVIGIYFFCKRRTRSPVVNDPALEPNDVNYVKMELNTVKYSKDVNQAQTVGATGVNIDCVVTPESLQYQLEEIEVATNNFSKDNIIGRGGFGFVYKGVLPNGQQIAVKRLSNGSGQGDKEFQTEVVLLAQLRHKNLVRLLGFCLTDDEAILVYEFVANKSLDYFLFDSDKRKDLNWSCRFEIIKGVARGMMYIHEDSPVRMMHRDLKAANVLLDSEMYPKIADFGLARICDVGQTHINATRVVGTHGYMAPEYLFHGQFSRKSDVYALGILILEIVSGTKVSDSSFNQPGGEGLLSYAWRCWEDEKPLEVMDPLLRDSFSNDEIIKCVQLGLLCVQEDSNLRPTMSTVVHMLNSHSSVAVIATPQHPAYIYSGGFAQSTTVSRTSSAARLIREIALFI